MKALAALLLALALSGCASVPPAGNGDATSAGYVNPADPFESWNRKVFAFNDAVDEAVLKPVATAYRDALPELVRTGVDNVFGNFGDVLSTANHFLQGKMQVGLEMGMRVLVNTAFGLGGLLDPASEMGLARRSEDFGQTLGRWGMGSGPYLVLPLFGPSSLRDTAGLVVDRQGSVTEALWTDDAGYYAATALEVVNARSNLLSTTQWLSDIALDRYSFVRDGYLSRRLDQVYDGAPPLDTFEDEPADEPAPAAAPK